MSAKEHTVFGQLLFIRLRAAEKAIRAGRLDEAYRVLAAPDLANQRRASDARTQLAEKYLERAREHFQADRFREALADLDRADFAGVLKDQIGELRRWVSAVVTEQERKEDGRRELLRDARKRIECGSLAAGRRILEQAGQNDLEAQELHRAISGRADEAMQLAQQAERLLAQGRHGAAAERVRRAAALDAHQEAVARIESKVCQTIFQLVREAFENGKLGRCAHELAGLGELGKASATKREWHDALALVRDAGRCLQQNAFRDARRHLLSVQRLFQDVGWVEKSIEQLRQLEELQTALAAGPLAETLPVPGFPQSPKQPAITTEEPTVAFSPRVKKAPEVTGQGLLLLVDGGGSYLILRGDRVSLGRVASDQPADIPLFTDLAERHAEIARTDDDYFLFGARDVAVGGSATRHQLLRDGDRIVLGRRGKLTFRIPSRQSSTAALDLSDTTKMPNDVRRVVLFSRHALIGNGASAHVRCRHAGASLVLFERSGALWVRPKSDGHVDLEAKPLTLGEPIEIGGIRMTLEPWRVKGWTERIA
jgi:hypothetical protein